MIYEYKGGIYPDYLKTGNAQKYIEHAAAHFCQGEGLDIGGFDDWTFKDSKPINITIDDDYDAYNLPDKRYDYIFSSHCLEHLPEPKKALHYWKEHLKPGGVLYLYLPHPDMTYWLPENNHKHLHSFKIETIVNMLKSLDYKNIINSERDMYWSFSVVAFKEGEKDG